MYLSPDHGHSGTFTTVGVDYLEGDESVYIEAFGGNNAVGIPLPGAVKATADPCGCLTVGFNVPAGTGSIAAVDAVTGQVRAYNVWHSDDTTTPGTDTDLAMGPAPADVATPATSSSGAPVAYAAPTASDEDGPVAVVCDHSSGSVFLVGATKVTCSATDSDDTPSSVSTSFTVTVTNLTMGPQAMEGSLQVVPGEVLKVGYDFTIPGTHPQTNVSFVGPGVSFVATCVSGQGGGRFSVATPKAAYADPAGSSAWLPSGDQSNTTVYQGQIAVPDLCGGRAISLKSGGTFTALVGASVTSSPVHVRWHYSAGGSAGGWSATASVTPASVS